MKINRFRKPMLLVDCFSTVSSCLLLSRQLLPHRLTASIRRKLDLLLLGEVVDYAFVYVRCHLVFVASVDAWVIVDFDDNIVAIDFF
jgi:hypothetical protein